MKTCILTLMLITLFAAGLVDGLSASEIGDFNRANASLWVFLSGAQIYAQDEDNTYLGSITNKYNSDSVLNTYGNYGSQYNAKSIWNNYGSFGGAYSTYSPFNKYSSKPPVIMKNNRIIGYLTVNSFTTNGINPNVLKLLEE